jgi:hypothetical protein
VVNRITINEHELFHALVDKLRAARDKQLIRQLYVDERNYTIKAHSQYGEWSVSLKPLKPIP